MRPRLPSTIQVGPHRYKVVSNRPQMNEVCRKEGRDLLGHVNHWSLTISIEPTLAADQKAETVLHEALHAAVTVAGLGDEWGVDKEEAVVNRLSPVLLDVLRRNPKLIAYLLDLGDT